jgi:signal transduction histidine kinase
MRLDSGRFQAERRAFQLYGVVRRAVEAFSQSASLSGHQFQIDATNVSDVYADPADVERVLRNLVSNALKYSPAGGQVSVVAAEREGSEVEICVEDRGLGIPAEWLALLFERFQRVDLPDRASICGTRLGLYIARQLVELDSGRIWATSEGVNRGATLHFTLPVRYKRPRISRLEAL